MTRIAVQMALLLRDAGRSERGSVDGQVRIRRVWGASARELQYETGASKHECKHSMMRTSIEHDHDHDCRIWYEHEHEQEQQQQQEQESERRSIGQVRQA